MQQQGQVVSDGIVVDTERPTTQKLRIVSAHQQIARIDFEDAGALSADLEERVIAAAQIAIEAATVVIISDYGKGLLTDRVLREAIDMARTLGQVGPWSIRSGATGRPIAGPRSSRPIGASFSRRRGCPASRTPTPKPPWRTPG